VADYTSPHPKWALSLKVRRVTLLILAFLLTFIAGYAAATWRLKAEAAAGLKPLGDIQKTLEAPFPAATGTVEVGPQNTGYMALTWEAKGRIGDRCSVMIERQIALLDHSPPPEDDFLQRQARLQDICQFYRDYIRSLGFRFQSQLPDGSSLVLGGGRNVLYVSADYEPYGPVRKECIVVRVLLFDTGFAAPKH